MKIPKDMFLEFTKWMVRGPWPMHLQIILHEHLNDYCDVRDIDSFEEMADDIGSHTLSTLRDIAFNDFLSRETEDGNVVDDYLKRRGWKEKAVTRTYMQAIRDSFMSLYEVSDIRPGSSFLARDLILDGDPIRVEEQTATKTLTSGEHIAAWIVDVRDHWMIAGGILPFAPQLSEKLQKRLFRMADETELGLEEILEGDEPLPDDDILQKMALAMTLKIATPVFSAIWLADLKGDAANPSN
ncbi:MAG: hypothetical protein OEU92_27915 [Alphaproteobacteria bacterium]|nr:hypothetical protein [Alphaproteobacteria bacterium]